MVNDAQSPHLQTRSLEKEAKTFQEHAPRYDRKNAKLRDVLEDFYSVLNAEKPVSACQIHETLEAMIDLVHLPPYKKPFAHNANFKSLWDKTGEMMQAEYEKIIAPLQIIVSAENIKTLTTIRFAPTGFSFDALKTLEEDVQLSVTDTQNVTEKFERYKLFNPDNKELLKKCGDIIKQIENRWYHKEQRYGVYLSAANSQLFINFMQAVEEIEPYIKIENMPELLADQNTSKQTLSENAHNTNYKYAEKLSEVLIGRSLHSANGLMYAEKYYNNKDDQLDGSITFLSKLLKESKIDQEKKGESIQPKAPISSFVSLVQKERSIAM